MRYEQVSWPAPPWRARTRFRSLFNLTPRDIDSWNDLADRLQPSEAALQRFVHCHPEVRSDRIALVWEAFLAWVRIRGRNRVPLCQPSLAVDQLWQDLVEVEPVWPLTVMPRIPVRSLDSRKRLAETHEQAHWDEFAARLPMLFLVDEAVGIAGGRLYRAECIVDYCKQKSEQGNDPEPGRTCLHGIPWVATPSSKGLAP